MRLKPLSDYTQSSSSSSKSGGGFEKDGAFGSMTLGRSGVSKNSKIFLIGALAVFWTSLLAALALRLFNSSPNSTAALADLRPVVIEKHSGPEMIDVLTPVRVIQPNSELKPEDFIKVQRPRMAVGNSAVTSFDEIRGTYAKAMLPANQVVSKDLVSHDQAGNAVIQNIPAGFRAVTINVSATTGVEGWARADAHVDVVWIGDLRGERVARKLVENTKILSAERRVDPHADPTLPVPTTMTLLVAEKDSQRVGLAQTAGSLVLLLRGANDTYGGNNDGTLTWSDLIGKPGNQDEKNVEGVVRVKDKGGNYKEFAIVDGAVMKRKE